MTRRGSTKTRGMERLLAGNQSYHKFAVKESNTLTRHFIAQRSASFSKMLFFAMLFSSLLSPHEINSFFFLTPLDCEGRISRPKTEMGRSPKFVGRASYVTRGMKQRSMHTADEYVSGAWHVVREARGEHFRYSTFCLRFAYIHSLR